MDSAVVVIIETVGAVTLLLAAFIARHYGKAYIAAKGENLATKEDIGAITALVEEVKKAVSGRYRATTSLAAVLSSR